MPTANPQLVITQGATLQRPMQAVDYSGTPMTGIFQDTDVITGTIWPAGANPDALLPNPPTGAWISSAAGTWTFTLASTDTAALPPGSYRVFVGAVRGSVTATLLDSTVVILEAGATLSPGGISSATGLPDATALALVDILWCTDENIAVRCGPDFNPLMPDSQMMAWGNDGVFSPSDPWTLTSASNDFTTQLPALWTLTQVSTNIGLVTTPSVHGYVVWLRSPGSAFPAGGTLMAVAAVSDTSVTLRRLGLPANMGQPPSPSSGLTGVGFQIATFKPQIEEVTYDINQKWTIDSALTLRTATNLYDIRPLRRLTVAKVLLDRYTDESRAGTGDYSHKVELIKQEIDDLEAKVQLRWGTGLATAPQTRVFNMRIER